MGRNTTGGKKHKKGKGSSLVPKEIPIKDGEFQCYAWVESVLGDGRFSLVLDNGCRVTGTVRGSMRKRVWVTKDGYVLASLREFDRTKVDIIHVYTYEEGKTLSLDKEFPGTEDLPQEDLVFEESMLDDL